MTKHFLMYCALALSSSLTQCSKSAVSPDDTLPPETQTGAGTFACKINGVVWKYNNPDPKFLDTRPKTNWNFDPNSRGGTLQVIALKYYDPSSSTGYDEIIHLIADSLIVNKSKYLNKNGFNYGFRYQLFFPKNSFCTDYNSSGINDTTKKFNNSGTLLITKLDQATRIVSGNFNCVIYESFCDSINITEGRFDLKY